MERIDKLDDKDLALLRILQNNSKKTIKELAAEVNLSPTPVFERVRRLEENGYIKRYSIVIDAEKLNRGFSVFCRIKLKAHDRDIGIQFAQEVLALDEITECYNISGDFDYLLKIQVRDMKHYQDFIFNKLGRLDTFGSTNSTFIMEEIKNIYGINI